MAYTEVCVVQETIHPPVPKQASNSRPHTSGNLSMAYSEEVAGAVRKIGEKHTYARGLLHQLGQVLVHHGVPKGVTTHRLPAAGACIGGEALHVITADAWTGFGAGRDLLQQAGAMFQPALGQLVCGVVQPVPVGELHGVLR